MAIEIEGRILNIDPEETKAKLLAIGAKPLGFYNFRRYVFDPAVGAPHRWLRLRTDGNKPPLLLKNSLMILLLALRNGRLRSQILKSLS